VRDVTDEIVQASLAVLNWMWKERKDWFESKLEELGGLHEELVNYYSEQVRLDKERSDELASLALGVKCARARTFIQIAPPQ
jgi:hypothetical protein